MFGWGRGMWHPPMLVPCEGDIGIDTCHTMRAIILLAGDEHWRVRLDTIETCPICGHVRARRIYTVPKERL